MKNYIITFDPHKSDPELFHSAITTIPGVTEWWHYLGSTYIVKTTATPEMIEAHVRNRTNDAIRFLASEIATSLKGGLLPAEAWVWINSKTS